MKKHSRIPGSVLDGVDWSCWSVVMLKPDCLRRGLVDKVLDRIGEHERIVTREEVTVADWQIHVHYWDLLVDRDWFSIDVVSYLRRTYTGQKVVIALVHGGAGTPERVRALLGHYDPAVAKAGTIRGDLGDDSQEKSRAEGRLIENLVHTSDDPPTVCRDFGTWFGADRHELLFPSGPSASAQETSS
ncbi:nucleoside-diphosphate kinase [Streptomyces sp. NPDC057654]|uniref:nucleoside-diphosphate kinase n=1 Tax=Streptomyces sp. NPDC057654 TaxID=3346196 RepID=UPI0036C3FF19